MATLMAAYSSEKNPWALAGLVTATAFVLWIAHFYSRALAWTIAHGRPKLRDVGGVGLGELGILLAAAPPVIALLLGAIGLIRESSSVWLALITGLVILGAEGVRYARLEGFGRAGTLAATGLNLALGLLVVTLKVLIAH